MYSQIKKNIKSIIPKQFLFKNELLFRYFYGLFYLGNNHECNICKHRLKSFIKIESNDLLCPFCGSLSRNRRLWNLFNENNLLKGNILHFSPSRSLFRVLKKSNNIQYFSTDFENEFLADYKFDITNIPQEQDKFDVIICYHILEHILDDKKAISELYRVLKPSGTIFIQTPFKDGDIYEDSSFVSVEERLVHFGQSDHVRIYSIDGLKKRLENKGFKVSVNTFENNVDDFYKGYKSPETVLMASKS